MKKLDLVYAASALAWACGPGAPSSGSGGTNADDTGGASNATGGENGNGETGGDSSGGAAEDGSGARPSGGSTGGTSQATGGQQGGTGGSAPVEPGSALDRYLQGRQPKVLYFQQIFGEFSRRDAVFDPDMFPDPGICDYTVVGSCVLSDACLFPYDLPALDVGTISLTHAEESLVSELVDGSYSRPSSGYFDVMLAGGEPLVLAATGGADLPAFQHETSFPLVILMDSPAGDLTAPVPAPITADLTLEFRRASGDVVLLVHGNAGSVGAWRDVLCIGSGDPGTLVLPQQALAYLGPGVDLDVFTAALESIEVGGQSVRFEMLGGTTNEERVDLFRLVTE